MRPAQFTSRSPAARRWVAAAVSLVLVATAACSSGSDGPSREAVSSGLQPTVDGFAFANFPSVWYPEEFGVEDMVAMFGTDPAVCVDGVAEPCTLTAEAASFARMVNQSRAAGHCEGLAAVSQARFNAGATPATADLLDDPETIKTIMRAFATQFVPEVRTEVERWMGASLEEKVEAVRASLAEGRLAYSLGVYTADGGHAVLPFAVEYPSEDQARVMVYDSNWPGRNRYVDVDFATDTWSFSFSGDDPANDPDLWTGGASKMDLTNVEAREGSCPFCSSDVDIAKNVLLVRSTDLNWSVDNGGETITPGDPGSDGDGVVVAPVKGQGGERSTYDYLVELPPGPDGELSQLTLPGNSSVFALTPSGIAQITSPGNANAPIGVGSDSFVSSDPNVTLSVASGNLVASASGPSARLSIGGDTLSATVTTADGQTVEVAVTPDAPAAKIEADPDKGGVTVLAQAADGVTQRREIASDGSETVTIEPTPLNLNSTTWEAPPGLESAPLPMLPSPDERNLNNPNYAVDQPYEAPAGAARIEEPPPTTAAPTTTTPPTTVAPTTTAPPTTVAPRPTTTVPPPPPSTQPPPPPPPPPTTTTTIAPVDPALVLPSLPASTFGDAPIDVAVATNSPAPVTFTSSNPAVASITSTGPTTARITINALGSTTITAAQTATGRFTAATRSRALIVAAADPALSLPAIPSVTYSDTPIDVAVTTDSPAPVTFTSSNPAVASITSTGPTTARITINALGSTTITASQVAAGNFGAATRTRTLTVNAAQQAPLVVNAAVGVPGAPLTLGTSGGSGDGAITFALVGPGSDECSLIGNQLSRAKTGLCTVRATKAGDARYDAATSSTVDISFVGVIHGRIDEGGTLTLTAPAGTRFSAVIFASYGTPAGNGPFVKDGCDAADSVSIVAGLAIGQTAVSIPALNDVFGDPCGGTYKALAVSLAIEPIP